MPSNTHTLNTELGTDILIADILKNARAIIFDCDGTLIDSSAIYLRAWKAALATADQKIDESWYFDHSGLSESALLDAFDILHSAQLDREAVIQALRAEFIRGVSELREFDKITSIARAAHGLIPIAIASGGPDILVRISLSAFGLTSLFDTIVTFDDVGVSKPKPDIFIETARRLDIHPRECLVVEDSLAGLSAAKAAGMRSLDVHHSDECEKLRSQLYELKKRSVSLDA
jgi:beta-phosphoglucomutase-like phosphatase (HAD superfamily)